ncbi:Helix-turn-helix domain-containing protein [Lentzea waywayandensis]|uniref:Helix-turn-helix domain-containing protein n=1 Tax=Lentzea waywayandensis TaxID=84724 RepID=A0A1I6DDA6_9PSEU|nr:Helix-turn-helix domain-containing protein [Lentzea waywayandensis]
MALGAFLRTHRALVRPEQAGLDTAGRRRVPGLRRDEVAMLAGVSAGYYARLEQGHERPTHETVESLKRALLLDETASVELHRLARPATRRRTRDRAERVSPHLLALLNDWTTAPAYVLGRFNDVLARNALAAALHSGFVHGDNLHRMIFLDPAGREFFLDWTATARAAVRDLRGSAGYVGAGYIGAGQVGAGHVSDLRGSAGHVGGGQVGAGYVSAGYVSAGHVSPGHVSAGHVSAGHVSAGHVSAGHVSAGHGTDERALRELVGELSLASPRFRRLWAEPEPRGLIAHGTHFLHPDVGELELRTEIFPITSAPGQRLVAQPAEPRSRSADALVMLGTLAA